MAGKLNQKHFASATKNKMYPDETEEDESPTESRNGSEGKSYCFWLILFGTAAVLIIAGFVFFAVSGQVNLSFWNIM